MRIVVLLLGAALLLGTVAHFRAPEYDEAYSLFLTSGHARPAWPDGVFTAGSVREFYSGRANPGQISHDLKTGDVHPPLYFWALEFWRRAFGPSWFAARILSVMFSLGALALVGLLAGEAAIPAMLLAMLSYGFAYTGIVARDFALAQFLNLLGFYYIIAKRCPGLALAAGIAFGAASFTNYLAVFPAFAVLAWAALRRWRAACLAAIGLAPFLALDASYFLAQRNSRAGQFATFSPGHALALLVKDSGAALFGGLPVYAGGFALLVTAALFLLFLACIFCVIKNPPRYAGPLILAAIATPLGLLALGFIFHNTPIEIRYLAFSLPFLALLFAASLPRPLRVVLLGVQACAIIGLILAPATMQPQGRAAAQASAFPGALILLPSGNDGVGIPGPFIAASPDATRLELLRPGAMPDLSREHSVVLATIRADDSSRTTTTQALTWFRSHKCFAPGPATPLTSVFLNRCPHQQR